MRRRPSHSVAPAAPRSDLRRWALVGVALAAATVLWASVASAQEVTPATLASVSAEIETPVEDAGRAEAPRVTPAGAAVASVNAGGPRLAPAAFTAPVRDDALTRREASRADLLRQENRPGFRRNIALIAVGLAAVVIGSEVDGGAGTVLILGGAGLSLYGFYQLLR
jgi:uncharacterized protein YcfJ